MSTPLPQLRAWIAAGVRREDTDLSLRQLAVLMTIQTQQGPHTVRGMAADLNVSKPAITRALDRLGELGLVYRQLDPLDRRSVNAFLEPAGANYCQRLAADWRAASKTAPHNNEKASA